MNKAKVLMLQGTSSSVGKSLLVAAFCRIFARRGVRVAPFKAQNMSNNAAVCIDGAEIGRSQAVQAMAAGIEPRAIMNPILLKPEAEARSQVIVLGHPWRTLKAKEYYQHKAELWPVVTRALDHLRADYDLVIIEGAGSPAELNLRPGDIVNMAVARHARAPVLLVGDIDRGGVFAQLLGTLWLLEEDQRLVRGLLVNKFRGDPNLFTEGVRILEERGGLPVLGVIPYLPDLMIPEEDAVALDRVGKREDVTEELDIAVIRLPRIANFDDFDPLQHEPGVRLRYVSAVQTLGQPDAIILPGTKSTIADLIWLQEQGLLEAIKYLASQGTAIAGICGGYQMLGRSIQDPAHVESPLEAIAGLGLLPVETKFAQEKATHQVQARLLQGAEWLAPLTGQTIRGYEIHMGRTQGHLAWLEIIERSGCPVRVKDGAMSPDGRIWGCYIHGLFENQAFRRAWLAGIRKKGHLVVQDPHNAGAMVSWRNSLERLADVVEAAVDMTRLEKIVWENSRKEYT